MSWVVDGVTYHNIYERDAALRRRNDRQARAEADWTRQQVRNLQGRIAEHERDLERAAGDLDRQIRVNVALEADVTQLRAAHKRLEAARRAMERQIAADFAEVRRDAEATRTAVDQLERAHEAHLREVQQAFEIVEREMRVNLAEVEERRRQTELRLKQAVDDVNRKVEADRQARLRKIASEVGRANEAIHSVENVLRPLDDRLAPLDLTEEAHAVREQLAQATAAVTREDSGAALAIASGAWGQARTLQYRAHRRAAVLEAHQGNALATVEALRKALAPEEVSDWFPHEVAEARDLLTRLEEKARQGYRLHARGESEAADSEDLLARLTREVERMRASASNVQEMAEERLAKTREVIEQLKKVYGPLSTIERQRFAVDGDPKSPLLLECVFGGARVNLRFKLDGEYTADGYAHESNASCSAAARGFAAQMGPERIRRQEVSAENRRTPVEANERRTADWLDVKTGLAQLRSKL